MSMLVKHQSVTSCLTNLTKMKLIIVVALALVAVAVAAPSVPEPVQILRSSVDQKPDGGYVFGFETEDGVSRDETGDLKEGVDEEKKPYKVVVVRGSYSYTDPEGKLQTITYLADENGYQAQGDAIPVAPVARR
ncbi:larval cuticle protein 16/17-like [Anticarsia gemmatalis]|uniref:larval cuticle protein 16/17-like n=1 Tax=Anticarsia gemmatalis TaxID=129554 RepID=UPI003F763ACA